MKKSLIFLANYGVEFNPETILERGLGGSVTAIIYMAGELAKLGNDVVVFCKCNTPGNYDGVVYKDIGDFGSYIPGKSFDVMVVSRALDVFKKNLPSRLKILWTQDAYDQPFTQNLSDKNIQNGIDKIFTVGKWQTETIMKHFGISSEKFYTSRNGINREFYENNEYKRKVDRLVYTSTPFRGLDVLLDVFPDIRARVPDAELFIYSSMTVYGVSEEDDKKMYEHLYTKCNQPGVYLKGGIPQNILADELKRSYLMAYPNHFAETSCIAAIEAQAAGLPAVTSELGELSKTVLHNETGICIPGNSRSKDYQDRFVKEVVRLINNKEVWNVMSSNAHHRALEKYSWDVIAREWDEEFNRELEMICEPPDIVCENDNSKNKDIAVTPNRGIKANSPPTYLPFSKEETRETVISSVKNDEKTISLCMIVKDEEKSLTRCLDSVKDYVDEMIIVDTGSTDRTVEIAKSFGAKIFNHPWEGSFSKARNYSLKYATCDWILYLDADEELSKEDAPRLKEIVKDNNATVISFVIKNKFKDSTQESYANMIRLFKNFIGIYYEGIVHNNIIYSGKCLYSPLSIIHHGYNLTEDEMKKKFLRTTTLLKKQVKTDPNNPIPHQYLAVSYIGEKMYDEAITEGRRAIDIADNEGKGLNNFLVSYYVTSAAYFEKSKLEKSEAYALKSVEIDDKFLDGYCLLCFVYYNLKNYDSFLHNSDKYLALWNDISVNPERANNAHTIGHKWKIRLLRGFYYLLNSQDETGNKEIDSAINESTEIEECHNLLGNFYLENNCLDKAEKTFRKLLAINRNRTDTMIKMGRIRFQKGDLNETIHFWKKAVDAEPTLFDIRLLVCKINIVQGNLEEVVTECNQLLQILDINRNIVLESLTDLASLFNLIGEKLEEKHDVQAAETAFKICKDLEQIKLMDTERNADCGLRIADCE